MLPYVPAALCCQMCCLLCVAGPLLPDVLPALCYPVSCNPFRVPVLQSISCNPCPAIHVLRSVSVFLSCDPFPAIHVCVHVLQSVSSNPCPAIRVLPTMSCPSCPAVPVLPSMSCQPCLPSMFCHPCLQPFPDPCPAIHIRVHVPQSVSCNPCPAIHVLQSMSCHPCPAIHVLPSISCHPYPAMQVLPSMSCHPCPAKTQRACPIRRLSSLLLADSLFTGWVGGFNFTLIEFPETFCGRHIEDTVKAVCVHAARNFPESRLCLCDFKEPVCREIFMLRDCTLPDVRN